MSEPHFTPFIGQITLFPYAFAPQGWADCMGQWMAIAQNRALFGVLGTKYGGDGQVSFGLPNLNGRAAVGTGTLPGGGTYALGEQAGAASVTILQSMMAPHRHALAATSSLGTGNNPEGLLLSQVAKGDLQGMNRGYIYNPGRPNAPLSGTSIAPTGGQKPHNNMQPSLALRYCIAVEGILPPRS